MARASRRDPLDGFRQFVIRQRRAWNVPGVAVGVVKDGVTLLAEGFGHRDLRKRLPATPDTLFAIASCTKAFTTMVLGMLAVLFVEVICENLVLRYSFAY